MLKESVKYPLDTFGKPEPPPAQQQEYDPEDDTKWTPKQWAAYLKSVWNNPQYGYGGFGKFDYEQHEQAAQNALRPPKPKTNYPSKSRSRPNWFSRNFRRNK